MKVVARGEGDRETERQTEKEQRGGDGGRERGGNFFLQTQRDGDRRDPKVRRKQESESKTWKLDQRGILPPKRPKPKEKIGEKAGGGDARVGGEVQWEGHLPPQGSSGLWGSAGRTRGSRASSLQPGEGVGDSGPRRFL